MILRVGKPLTLLPALFNLTEPHPQLLHPLEFKTKKIVATFASWLNLDAKVATFQNKSLCFTLKQILSIGNSLFLLSLEIFQGSLESLLGEYTMLYFCNFTKTPSYAKCKNSHCRRHAPVGR